MNLFILSIYDGGYGATMFENGFKVNLETEENRAAFIQRFKVAPEYATMKDLKVDGDIEVGDSFNWDEVLKK